MNHFHTATRGKKSQMQNLHIAYANYVKLLKDCKDQISGCLYPSREQKTAWNEQVQRTLGSDGNALYLECGGGNIGVFAY